MQFGQTGVPAYIQAGELIFIADQPFQLGILAHIQLGQLVLRAVQIFQFREELNAGQVFDAHTEDIDHGRVPLFLTEGAAVVCVDYFLHILEEVCVREVGWVNGDAARFCSGQGRNPFRQHRCAQRQGECSCHSGSADASNELVQIHKTPPLSRKGKIYPPVIILT